MSGSSFELETDSVGPSETSTLPGDSDTSSSAPSILDKLRAPRLSELTRKRKIHCNRPPPAGRRQSRGRGASDPKSITPSQRVKEFSDEHIVVSNGKLFCRACREELSTKRSVLSCHVKSKKHFDGKQRLKIRSVVDQYITEALG